MGTGSIPCDPTIEIQRVVCGLSRLVSRYEPRFHPCRLESSLLLDCRRPGRLVCASALRPLNPEFVREVWEKELAAARRHAPSSDMTGEVESDPLEQACRAETIVFRPERFCQSRGPSGWPELYPSTR
jgi:hypothetical protein